MKKIIPILLILSVLLAACGTVQKSGEAMQQPAYAKAAQASSIKTEKLALEKPALTVPVYRCWYAYHGAMNHYVSFDANCEGNNVDGLIGYVYKEKQPGTAPLFECFRATRHDHRTYRDLFVSLNECPAETELQRRIGYIPTSPSEKTITIYRCWAYPDRISQGRYDHMVSKDLGCEGFRNEGLKFYFLNAPVYPAPVPECTGDLRNTIKETEEPRTYTVQGKDYEVEAKVSENECRFMINGEKTDVLRAGDSYVLVDGLVLKIEDVFDKMVTFCLDVIEIEPCEGDIKDALEEGQKRTYTISGKDYEVEAMVILEEIKEARFKVNGETTTVLRPGESYILADGTVIQLENVFETQPGYATFCLKHPVMTWEVAISESKKYLGSLHMEGDTFDLVYYPDHDILEIDLPGDGEQEITINPVTLEGNWPYQGNAYHVKIDLQNMKIIFTL
ncbi:hypothetical protein KY346_04875 [Candidatus Woesearchaeota archaeon]|nr:hypothetical protein [Candidatus Woesearchaeota archaeon]